VSPNRRVRRHRVAMRPKVLRRRLRLFAAVAALAVLAAAGGLTARHLGRGVSARCAALKQHFSGAKSLSLGRLRPMRGTVSEVGPRTAVGRILRAGRPAGYLGDDGSVFTARAGIDRRSLPDIDIGNADAAQLKALPAALADLARNASLPSPLARMSFRSPYEGWAITLADGTEILWGGLGWTREKLVRLRQALADARGSAAPSGNGPWLADLRSFEDGRVLLRPVAGRPLLGEVR